MISNISFTQNLSLSPYSGNFFPGESCLRHDFFSFLFPLPYTSQICIDEKRSAAIYCRNICKFAQDATVRWLETSGIVNNEGRSALKSLWSKVFDIFNQYSCGHAQHDLMHYIGKLADLDSIKRLLKTDYRTSLGDIAAIQNTLKGCKYSSDPSEIGTVEYGRPICKEGQDREVFNLASQKYFEAHPIAPIVPHNITYNSIVNETSFIQRVRDLNMQDLTIEHITKVKKDDGPIKYSLNGKPFAVQSSHWDELAYQLDHDHFAKVLPVAKHPKLGYLTMWLNNTVDVPINERLERANPSDLQKIFILDLRVYNQDRHKGNILFTKQGNNLVTIPIDHDELFYSFVKFNQLIDSLSDNHPAVANPFTEECIKYIQNIDVDEDAKIMENLGYDKEARFLMKYNTVILKIFIEKGLTVKEIWRFFRFEYTSSYCRWEDFSPRTNLKYRELYKVSEKDLKAILEPALEKCYPKILDDFEYFQHRNCFPDQRVVL